MIAQCYTLTMADEVLKQWHAFKHAQVHDVRVVEKLLALYKPPFLTNTAQLQRIGVNDAVLMTQLAQLGMVNQSLDELTEQTIYKILLTDQVADYPAVNIMNAHPNAEYVYTFKKGEPRMRLHQHLKALLASAKCVVLCDKYLQANWGSAKRIFGLFPEHSLTIVCTYDLSQSQKTELKRLHPQWKATSDRLGKYKGLHDRYLLIDGRMELTFTSGLDYLFDIDKECSVIMKVKANI